jgi:hypothetical protein
MANQTTPAIQIKDSNVGIGTTSPSWKLDVAGYIRANDRLYATNGTNTLEIGSTYIQSYLNSGAAEAPLNFYTGTTEKMRIATGGNVLIGTDTDAGYKLDVSGVTSTQGLYIPGLYTFGQSQSGIEMQLTSTSYNAIRFYQGTDYTGVIHSFGRSWAGGVSVGMVNIEGYNGVTIGAWNIPTATFLSSGNVGIGTTGPSSTLEVAGTLTLKSSAEGGPHIYRDGGNAGDVRFYSTNGTFASPTAKVAEGLLGQIHYAGYDGTSYVTGGQIWAIVDGAVSTGVVPARIEFKTGTAGAATQMTIKSSGNVLINTTTDSGFKLRVNGTAKFDGVISADPGITSGYGTILTGYNSSFQITVNADYSGGQTNTYTPQYAGVAGAGMFVMKQRNGGEGNVDIWVKQSGTDGSTQNFSTFTNILNLNTNGTVGIGVTDATLGLQVGDGRGFLVGNIGASGSTYVSPSDENTINGSYGIGGDDADIWLNYRGYQDGWSYFRDTRIGNGKGTAITYWNGDTGNMMIGTTTDNGEKLQVWGGNITVGGTTYPSIAFNPTSGTNFGITNRYTDNRLSIDVIGTGELINFLSNGNVGINSTNPGERLVVNAASGSNSIIYATTDTGQAGLKLLAGTGSTNRATRIDFLNGVASGTVPRWTLLNDYNQNGTNDFRFIKDDQSTSVLTLLQGGNVGIGTTAPDFKLDVNGDVRLGTSLLFSGTNSYPRLGRSTNDLTFQTDASAEVMRITNAGNVGIGTTTPTYKLQVSNKTRLYNVSIGGTDGGTYDGYSDSVVGFDNLHLAAQGAGAVYINTSIARPMYINPVGGNVGIGTTAPGYKLDVSNGSSNVYIRAITSGAANWATLLLENGDGSWHVTNDDTGTFNIGTGNDPSAQQKLTIASTGNVLIGTTTDSGFKLRVNGEILADDDIRIFNTFALVLNGTDNNWRIGRNTITDSGWLTGNTMQMVVFGGSTGQGFQVVNSNGTALFEIDGVAGASRFTNALGVGVNPSGTAGRIDASNDIVAYSSSDLRLKENIKPIENALDKVKALTGVEFDWKAEHKEAHGYEGHDTGIIAQEVQEVMPTAVRVNDTGYLAVRYEKLIGLLVEANKELAARVEELEKKLK